LDEAKKKVQQRNLQVKLFAIQNSAKICSWSNLHKCIFINISIERVCPLFQRCKELSKKIRMIEREARKKKIRDTILAGGTQGLWHGYSSVVMKYYCTVLFRVFGDSISN